MGWLEIVKRQKPCREHIWKHSCSWYSMELGCYVDVFKCGWCCKTKYEHRPKEASTRDYK